MRVLGALEDASMVVVPEQITGVNVVVKLDLLVEASDLDGGMNSVVPLAA